MARGVQRRSSSAPRRDYQTSGGLLDYEGLAVLLTYRRLTAARREGPACGALPSGLAWTR